MSDFYTTYNHTTKKINKKGYFKYYNNNIISINLTIQLKKILLQ